jgi:hypothetical protein
MPDVINFEKERKNEKRRRSTGGESVILVEDEEEDMEREGKRRKLEKGGSRESGKGKANKLARQEVEEEEEAEVEDVISVSKEKPKLPKGVKGKTKAPAAEEFDEELEDRPMKSKINRSQEQKGGSRNKNE